MENKSREKARKPKLDKLDVKLLRILQRNSRASLKEMSRELGITDVAVHYRLNKLRNTGVIRGFTVLLDPERLGLDIKATFGFQVGSLQLEEVAKELAEHPSFYLVWIVSGAHNVHAKAAFATVTEMQDVLVNFLHKIDGVKDYHMSLLLRTVKEKVEPQVRSEN